MPRRGAVSGQVPLVAGRATYLVEYVRHRRARHYILKVLDDGRVRVTVPRGGTRSAAERFVRDKLAWVQRERYRCLLEAARRGPWLNGTKVLWRGTDAVLETRPYGSRLRVLFADQRLMVPASAASDLRPHVERHLQRLAARELPARVREIAAAHGFQPKKVTVRNQRSRWGACSPSGRISLNWRLVQMPPAVRDYVLIHELVHLERPDHSARFWREVERLCPWHQDARRWLRVNPIGE
jgi:predicted metal-dependent hydrolase